MQCKFNNIYTLMEEPLIDEVAQLKLMRAQRRQKKEWELKMMGKCVHWLIVVYVIGLVTTTLNYLRVLFFNEAQIDKEFQYEGIVEDSCQDFKTLKEVNDQIFPLLDELTVILKISIVQKIL